MTFPPNNAIRGWWNSGLRMSDDAHTLCAVVDAEDEDAAKNAIQRDWPEAQEWRFVKEYPDLWTPGDRFPADNAWCKDRLASMKETPDDA